MKQQILKNHRDSVSPQIHILECDEHVQSQKLVDMNDPTTTIGHGGSTNGALTRKNLSKKLSVKEKIQLVSSRSGMLGNQTGFKTQQGVNGISNSQSTHMLPAHHH